MITGMASKSLLSVGLTAALGVSAYPTQEPTVDTVITTTTNDTLLCSTTLALELNITKPSLKDIQLKPCGAKDIPTGVRILSV